MRRLLDAMRYDGDELELAPHPGLDQLGHLVEDVRASGLDVNLWIGGEPFDLPAGLDLSAYRILQEGLTNVLKHAHASRADVEVHYRPHEVRVEVRDDGKRRADDRRRPRPRAGRGRRAGEAVRWRDVHRRHQFRRFRAVAPGSP